MNKKQEQEIYEWTPPPPKKKNKKKNIYLISCIMIITRTIEIVP